MGSLATRSNKRTICIRVGDTNPFTLPWNWKPDSDLMSKLLFNDPTIVNLVVQSLLGADLPANSYTVASNDWADDFGSTFMVYILQNENVSRCTPIVINTQVVINSDSISDTILFCRRVYEKFKILPTFLIIPTKSINSEKLGINEGSFLIPLKSTFWASKCFLFSPSGTRSADDRTISALVTICRFISSPNKIISLYDTQFHNICLTCEAKSNVKEK